jgi:hypothetical protein
MRRIYPAHGRELMRRRQAGQVPSGYVLVALNFWPRLGSDNDCWPGSAVVVFDDMPLARLELRMLAGVSVLIACDRARAVRAADLALLVAKVDPAERIVWILDFETPSLTRLLCGRWASDFSTREPEHMHELAQLLSAQARRSREHDRSAA